MDHLKGQQVSNEDKKKFLAMMKDFESKQADQSDKLDNIMARLNEDEEDLESSDEEIEEQPSISREEFTKLLAKLNLKGIIFLLIIPNNFSIRGRSWRRVNSPSESG